MKTHLIKEINKRMWIRIAEEAWNNTFMKIYLPSQKKAKAGDKVQFILTKKRTGKYWSSVTHYTFEGKIKEQRPTLPFDIANNLIAYDFKVMKNEKRVEYIHHKQKK